MQTLDTDRLFREAEIRAEALVAILRMAIALALGALFAVAVLARDVEVTPVLARQWSYAGATMLAYFGLGLASWWATRKDLFRRWMIWPAAAGDCLFLLVSLWLGLGNTDLPASTLSVFPALWLAPVVLAFGVLRSNPAVQACMAVVIVLGLLALLNATPRASFSDALNTQDVALFFATPPNLMRVGMLALAGAVLVVASLRTRTLLRRSIAEAQHTLNLTRYLPAQLAPRLAQSGLDELRMGERREMAILFVDMRGFTSLTQPMTPHEISVFMTEYRNCISAVAQRTGGIIDKFMGDAAIILFDHKDHQRAAASALAFADQLPGVIKQWSDKVDIGIGIHWGEVFCGVIGDQDRLEYSVFGDTVNTAARLEEMTKDLGQRIVASIQLLDTAQASRESWTTLPDAEVRGRTGLVPIMGYN